MILIKAGKFSIPSRRKSASTFHFRNGIMLRTRRNEGWELAAGCWRLVAGGWWLAAGCWRLVAGCCPPGRLRSDGVAGELVAGDWPPG
ncbi:MAG: hypothetical protein R2759_06200 [Bacteroidales bacterium]